MSDFLRLDADTIKRELDALFRAYPELLEDEELRLDMLEGETDLLRILSRLVDQRQDARSTAEAIRSREQDMAERRKRFERRAEASAKLMQSLMEAAHQDKITLPEATLSVTKARESVNVTDVDQLPQGYFKTIRQADKTALKAALMAGETIPGAEMQIGENGFMVRTK